MQKHVTLVDLVKSFPTNIYLQNLASIQKRTSPVKFAHLAEKSGKGSISNLSTKEHTIREQEYAFDIRLYLAGRKLYLAAPENLLLLAGRLCRRALVLQTLHREERRARKTGEALRVVDLPRRLHVALEHPLELDQMRLDRARREADVPM